MTKNGGLTWGKKQSEGRVVNWAQGYFSQPRTSPRKEKRDCQGEGGKITSRGRGRDPGENIQGKGDTWDKARQGALMDISSKVTRKNPGESRQG